MEPKKLVLKLVRLGAIRYSAHALERLQERDLSTLDVRNVLDSPDFLVLGEAEFEGASYRYRIGTRRILVVVSFNSTGTMTVIVTVARRK